MFNQDAIITELAEIEHALQDTRLSDDACFALTGASQALRQVLDRETWQSASQSFYRLDARPDEAASSRRH